MGRRYNRIKILVKEDRTPYTGKRDFSGGWRKKIISESDWTPVAGSIANSTSQTFEYPGGSRVTVSGLGGVETTPSTVTVNQFGDVFDVPGPNYSQLGLQGYAPPLGNVNRRRDYEDVNPRLDASQEFARNVKSDVFMNARVDNMGMINPSAYADAMKSVVNAVNAINPSLKYKAQIAQSVLSNEPIEIPQSEIPKSHIKALINGIENDNGLISQLMQTYTNTPTPYSDENIYELPNGEVRAHTPETRKLYPDNTRPVGYDNNPIAGEGQAQMELVDPKDGQPYIKYRDHAYHNLKSKDTGELPDVVSVLGSGAVHTLAGKNNPDTPNTGAMSNYPSNIKGDAYKTVIIPYSEFSPKIRRAVNDKIGVEQQRAAGINVGSPEVNTGTGKDGTFGRGTYGQGRPSDPKSSFTLDKETGEPQYTGMSHGEYIDRTNEINAKWADKMWPLQKKLNDNPVCIAADKCVGTKEALMRMSDAATKELEDLYDERERQTSEFQNALDYWFAQQDAENKARQDALDKLDNEKNPHTPRLDQLNAMYEKLSREGKLIKGYKILGPGDEGYTDYSKIGGALDGNRKPIYTAAALKLYDEIQQVQKAWDAWQDGQQEKRDAIGGQGGLPIGSTSLRGGAGDSAGARKPTPPENMSQSAALARQAAFARANPQQRRKNRKKYSTEETTWSRIKKHLSEGMTTANMGAVYHSGEGDVDLATAVADFTLSGPSGHGWNSVTKSLGSDRSKYDTIVVTVNSNSAEWEIIDGGWDTDFVALGKGGTGTYTVVIPRIYRYGSLYYTARDNGSISFSTKFQRRTPLNVFVPLDDPDANAFIKDGSTDNLSRAQKKKKLEDQLKSSEKYLNGKFSEGMPKGVTQIKDYEPQQSFSKIAAAPQQGPLPPGPRGYKKPGTYDPNKFYNLDNKTPMPSPNLPFTGPGYSKGIDGTKVAASYPTTNTPLDKVGGFKGLPKGKGWYPMDKDGNLYNPQTGLPIKKAGRKQRTMVAHHEPVGKVLSEKKRIKSRKSIVDKIRGYYDGKPSPLGFPVEEPPKMKNGYHPDLVDGKKVANRFNRLDPISARAMPKTGNPHIDKKVKVARKKPK